ncbi:hypothetical protein ACSCB1_25565 [Streptomyces europaeiscabiei]|uniref:hypothetical protein n=1 Tax=Streptomyces europaeiscabiei TaxID=146819 RepID=UPI00062837C1|nr:hypothetical protein [Streptomyces europaeiscabiei]MDX2529945.1 hypothetical protein [Streptomyces europaeiscabiei]MDX2759869.1 hypothetical protein [Streptomyces europaeiscabiei]MDX3778542.1 hypothetical protein [Streptomyces europaeiscabiei]MDX3836753.1 hypothetical protein [Streptomyces europaeiscabiei]MDX3843971.1 hypothetical protein [Streptomyces europaeiscabiei]
MDISGTHFRAVRAALFTAVVVTLSTASHVLLSGVPLPLTTVAAITAAVFLVAYALAGRERGFGRIAGVLIPLELAADTVFTTGQHACYGEAGGPVTGPLRQVGLDMLCGGGSVGAPLARVTGNSERAAALLAGAGPGAAWVLLAAHIGVGLLAAAWLRRGERALARLLDAAVAAGFRPLLIAVAAVMVRPLRAQHRPTRTAHRTASARPLLHTHSLGRRGPPCSVTFA